MEACGSAHYWARWLTGLGIEAKLLAAQYVRAYVQRNKTDAAAALPCWRRPGLASDNYLVTVARIVDAGHAFDASTIDLCLSVFAWAPFRSTKAAIKLHTLLDLRGNIPSFIHITDGKTHEVNILDDLVIEPGA